MLSKGFGNRMAVRKTHTFYRRVLNLLAEAEVPFLVGGAYALAHYTTIERQTKDLDVFVERKDCPRALDVLAAAGFHTELTFSHWIGKALSPDGIIDIIFSSGNGVCPVDEDWFLHADTGQVLGVPVRLVPPEEMIWQKAFILERDRADAADIAHLFRACAERIDWARLLRRFGLYWRVLLAHLVLFGFVYPGERELIPEPVMVELVKRVSREKNDPERLLCQGTLLSLFGYLVDVENWNYRDGRVQPDGNMTREEVDRWTAAFFKPPPVRRGM
jgi:hypothetical protein